MTTVASANILFELPAAQARTSLQQVLDVEPDLVGLQEWYLPRLGLLRQTGDVLLTPSGGLLRLPARRTARYHWVATAGAGCVVGARAERFDLVEGRSVVLSGLGRAERTDHPWNLEPPRIAAVGIFGDQVINRTVALISYHFVSGVQAHGDYRSDRPHLVGRHRQEVRRVEALVAELQRDGHVVYAVGDANVHLQALAGLTSAWVGREDEPGTFGNGRRKIDDVHGPGRASEVRLLRTSSDHRVVVAVRPD